MTCFLIFPNNLFKDITPLKNCEQVFVIEEFLFFRQYNFHKQKLLFHRASMKAYQTYLEKHDIPVTYINAFEKIADIRSLIPFLYEQGYDNILLYDPCDNWLQQRIVKGATAKNITYSILHNPLFINTTEELDAYIGSHKKYFQTDFYIQQRKLRKLLVDDKGKPVKGKWSFDEANRLKYPAKKIPPVMKKYDSVHHSEAAEYVEQYFSGNNGVINPLYFYAIDFPQAEEALDDFLQNRFPEFGVYEDAIVSDATQLHHSVLSALLNTGLLLPMQVVQKAIAFAADKQIPFNSLEGFVRQITGWREFIRMLYIQKGVQQRTTNYWKCKRKIPASFYNGSTGIRPIDTTIHKLQQSAYNHHIERLMILGNFMLLCEFDPDEVYKWFMEMYIDAYDWVMVPNIYGMTQFADGGLMCTKPYISSANYIFKMSNYAKGEPWAAIWDALFWRFMHVHRNFFSQNPRLGMLLKTFDTWSNEKQQTLLTQAETYLSTIS